MLPWGGISPFACWAARLWPKPRSRTAIVTPSPPLATRPSTSAPLRCTPWEVAIASANALDATRAPATPGRRASARARPGSATTWSWPARRRWIFRPLRPRAAAAALTWPRFAWTEIACGAAEAPPAVAAMASAAAAAALAATPAARLTARPSPARRGCA